MDSIWIKRLKSLPALVMVGEGAVAALVPRRYVLPWLVGLRLLRDPEVRLADHPGALRLVGILEAGAGLFVALRQHPGE